jgi:hypothetical protein
MDARRFFAMVKGLRRVRSWEFLQLCDIAAIPICDVEYYKQVRATFLPPANRPVVPDSSSHAVDSAGPEAMWAFMTAVVSKKGRH